MSGLLVVTIFLPLFGAALIWALADVGARFVRQSALVTTVFTFGLACWLVWNFPADGAAANQFTFEWNWLGAASELPIRFNVGLDGLALWLFVLSSLLMVTCVLVSWTAVENHARGFYALLLLLETGMLGVFAARDIILFYIFFEFTLIPLFFLIGIWGGEQRRYAAVKFFLYTLAGSVLTFLGLLAIVLWQYQHPLPGIAPVLTFSIPELTALSAINPMPGDVQLWIFLALFAGFAIKVPLFPLHTWLPLAHVQAPTAGSILLAGVLLKVGTYGFVRFSLPLLPEASVQLMPWVLTLSVAGIVYGALVALAQQDIKKLIAYSSVSHLGFCMVGLFAMNRPGVEGGVLQMIAHGLSTGGLFAVVGMLYERYHTREISSYSGMATKLPRLALCLLLLTFASIGVPGLCGFAGEFLLLLGMFQRAFGQAGGEHVMLYRTVAVVSVCGIVIGAWYMLQLVRSTFFGPLHEPGHGSEHAEVQDLGPRELAAVAPLIVVAFWIGLVPSFFLDRMGPTVQDLTASVEQRADELGRQEAQVARTQTQEPGAVARVD